MSRKKNKNEEKSKVTLDFRYGKDWSKISAKVRERCELCCFCLVEKSVLTHHIRYVDSENNLLLDNVCPGFDIFPVCEKCHRILHANKNWINSEDGIQFNHNSEKICNRLIFGWEVLSHGLL